MFRKRKHPLTLRGWVKLLFRQPAPGLYLRPSIYQSGRWMEIEHFRRIITYDESRLCLLMPQGRVTIYGQRLTIRVLTQHRITLCGDFLRTDFSDD